MILHDITNMSHEEATEECFSMADRIGRVVGRQMAIKSMLAEYGAEEVDHLRKETFADIRQHFEQGCADASDTETIIQAIELAALEEAFIVSCASWLQVGGSA